MVLVGGFWVTVEKRHKDEELELERRAFASHAEKDMPVKATDESQLIADLNGTLRSVPRCSTLGAIFGAKSIGYRRCSIYSRLMWRSGLREQHEHKEHEKHKHSQSNPETNDDGV